MKPVPASRTGLDAARPMAVTAIGTGAVARSAERTFATAYDTKRNNFDFLRFCLATLVIWSHSYPLSGREKDWFTIASGQIDGGSLAVDGFFLLSGFLVTQSWFSFPDVTVFAQKRLLRIVPGLLVALAFGALVVGPIATHAGLGTYFAAPGPWLHFFGVGLNRYLIIPGTFEANPLPEMMNAPLWSLRYELLCYALVAVVGYVATRTWGLVVASIFALTWTTTLLDVPLGTVGMALARLGSCFAAGMLFYRFRDRVPFHPALAAVAAAVLLATFLTRGFRPAFPVAGGYLLLFLAFTQGLGVTRFARYGDFSYGLYVLGYPIQQLLVRMLGTSHAPSAYFAMTFVLTLLLAAGSWHFVEAPALARKPRPSHGVGR